MNWPRWGSCPRGCASLTTRYNTTEFNGCIPVARCNESCEGRANEAPATLHGHMINSSTASHYPRGCASLTTRYNTTEFNGCIPVARCNESCEGRANEAPATLHGHMINSSTASHYPRGCASLTTRYNTTEFNGCIPVARCNESCEGRANEAPATLHGHMINSSTASHYPRGCASLTTRYNTTEFNGCIPVARCNESCEGRANEAPATLHGHMINSSTASHYPRGCASLTTRYNPTELNVCVPVARCNESCEGRASEAPATLHGHMINSSLRTTLAGALRLPRATIPLSSMFASL